MESKINKIRRDLRGLKKSSHLIQRLIETKKLHYEKIEALESLPKSEATDKIIQKEKKIIEALGIDKAIANSQELSEKYARAINELSVEEKVMITDHFFSGMPFWKMAVEYGYAEDSIRKKVDRIVKKISALMQSC